MPRILPELAPIAVGAILIATAVLKAARPTIFRRHLAALGWIPVNLLDAGVVIACLLEAGWGVGLIIGYRRSVLFPFSIVAFAILSIISWVGVKSGKTEDCGCYGGVISPSIYQSVGLNLVYSIAIALAWIGQQGDDHADAWRAIVTGLAAASLGVVAGIRLRKDASHPALSPLQPGARWNRSWSGGRKVNVDGEVLVSFLGPDCPHCKRWVRIANVMVQSPRLPQVLGVVSVDQSRLEQFRSDYEIKFPVARIARSRMLRLAPAVPTTVLVDDGTIEKVWVGNMPPDFSERFIDAFFEKSEVTG